MNVNSTQPLSGSKYVYVGFAAVLAAILLIGSFGPAMLASGSDDDDGIEVHFTGTWRDTSRTVLGDNAAGIPVIVVHQVGTFSGDISGEWVDELGLVPGTFWGVSHCECTIAGKTGILAIAHLQGPTRVNSDGTVEWDNVIIAGLGELEGIRGEYTARGVITDTFLDPACTPVCIIVEAEFWGIVHFPDDDDSDSESD